jgi:hypothetical protein
MATTQPPVNEINVSGPQTWESNGYGFCTLASKVGDSAEKIIQSVGNAASHLSNDHLALNNRISDGVEKITSDICATTGKLSTDICTTGQNISSDICDSAQHSSDQHLLLSNRISDVGEKSITSTLSTGKEILKDQADAARTLGVMIDGVNKDVIKTGCDVTSALFNSNQQWGLNVKDSIDRGTISTNKNLTDAHVSINKNITDAQFANERMWSESRLQTAAAHADVKNAVSGVNTSVLLASKDADLRICETKGALALLAAQNEAKLSKQLCHVNDNVTSSKCELERQAAEYKASLERQVAETKFSIERQAAEYKNSIEKEVIFSRCATERQIAETKNSIELDAHKNREAIQRQLSECCCELKEKVEDRFTQTVQLMRELDTGRLRDKLAAVEQENLFLRLQRSTSNGNGNGIGLSVANGAGVGNRN